MTKNTKRGRRRKHNNRRRARLIAQGLTPGEAQALIDDDGRAAAEAFERQVQADKRALRPLRDANNAQHPLQPEQPRSVYDFPAGAFETNRRRH